MPDNQGVTLWDNPIYAWQQQLASGANLAKNLNWQTLLGLNLGTLLGNRLGNIVGNWQQESDFLQRMKNGLIDKGYSDVTYDKATRRFMGFDANGNAVYFGRNGEIIPQQPAAPATNYNPQNPLWQKGGDFDLSWRPPQEKYPFPTANKLISDRFTPNFDWRQNNRLQQPFFPMTPTLGQVIKDFNDKFPSVTQTTAPNYGWPWSSGKSHPAYADLDRATPTVPATPTVTAQTTTAPTLQYPNPSMAKSVYDNWRLNHFNNQPVVNRPFQ